MTEKKEADGFSKDIAGKGQLDDEMLPNRGEPVPQDEPRSEGRDAEGAQHASGMMAGGEQATRGEVGDLDLDRSEMRGGDLHGSGMGGNAMRGGIGEMAGESRGSTMRRTTEGDMRDIREHSSTGETGGMGGSKIMDRHNRGGIEENEGGLGREERERHE